MRRPQQVVSVMSWRSIRPAFTAIALGVLLVACSSKEERAQQHYERGLELQRAGEIAKAGLEFRNALTLNNDMVSALFALADVEQQQGRIDRAASFYQKVIELDPRHVDARIRFGHIILAAGAIDQADKFAKEALDLEPTRADVLLLNAAVAFKRRDFHGATMFADSALEIDSNSADAKMILAAIRLDAGDAKGALAYLDAALQGQENNVSLNLFKIRVLEELGDKAAIEKVLVRMAELVPDYLPGRLALVQFYASSGEADKAIGVFRHLVDERSDNVDIGISFVEFLRNSRGADAARTELERRLKQPKPSYRYTVALARVQFGQGKTKEAMDILRQFLEQEPAETDALDVRTELGRMLFASNDKAAATELIEAVLAADARHVGALSARATIRLKDGDVEGAIADLRTALNEDPKSSQVNLVLAEAYEMAGHLELAQERLAETAANAGYEPRSTAPYLAFLRRYQKLDRVEDVLTRVLAASPSDIETLKQLADVRLRRGNWTGAQEIADALRKADGGPVDVANQIEASSLYAQGQYDASLALLKNIGTSEDASGRSLSFLIRAYLAAGKADEALAYLRSVVDKDPKNGRAFALLGSVEMSKGNPKAAESSFQRALELQPDVEGNYQALAELRARAGDLAAADEVIGQGIARLPRSVVLQISRAGIMERKGEFDAAIKTYEHALELDPLSLVAVNNLASLLADYTTDTANLGRAYALSQRLDGMDIPFFQDTAGWVHYRRGEYGAAERLLEQAAKGLPRLALVHYHLGKTRQALGKTKLAADDLKRAIELGGDSASFPQRAEAAAALEAIVAKDSGMNEGAIKPEEAPRPAAGADNG